MSSKIEQIIEEIEDYIDKCKYVPLSSTKIMVEKEEIEELLSELRTRTPEEIKRYQKIISNKEAILAEAQSKADQIIEQAQVKTDELVSEHEIMQQAYARANEVVIVATNEAQEIINKATSEANMIRTGAMAYTDSQLKDIQDILINSIDTAKARNDNFINTLQGYLDTVTANRAQLYPEPEAPKSEEKQEEPLPEIKVDDSDLMNNN